MLLLILLKGLREFRHLRSSTPHIRADSLLANCLAAALFCPRSEICLVLSPWPVTSTAAACNGLLCQFEGALQSDVSSFKLALLPSPPLVPPAAFTPFHSFANIVLEGRVYDRFWTWPTPVTACIGSYILRQSVASAPLASAFQKTWYPLFAPPDPSCDTPSIRLLLKPTRGHQALAGGEIAVTINTNICAKLSFSHRESSARASCLFCPVSMNRYSISHGTPGRGLLKNLPFSQIDW